jgi:hypothetical protein
MLGGSTNVGEGCLGSLHTKQLGGTLEAIEELAEHLVALRQLGLALDGAPDGCGTNIELPFHGLELVLIWRQRRRPPLRPLPQLERRPPDPP